MQLIATGQMAVETEYRKPRTQSEWMWESVLPLARSPFPPPKIDILLIFAPRSV